MPGPYSGTPIFVETCPVCETFWQRGQIHQHADGSWVKTEEFWQIRVERSIAAILKRIEGIENLLMVKP
jgi:hypothetical protein